MATNKNIELDGRMTTEGIDINSAEYYEALGVLHNRIQERTFEEQVSVEMTALKVKMKKEASKFQT